MAEAAARVGAPVRSSTFKGQRFFVQLDPRLDDATEQAEDIIVAHGGQLTREIAAADFCLLQHRKQPEHEEALHLMRRTVNLVWVLASVARGCPAPYAEPGDVGGQRYRPFPLSALVTPTAFHGTASSYNGDAKRIIYLLFQCLGAEPSPSMLLSHHHTSILVLPDTDAASAKAMNAKVRGEFVVNSLWLLDSLVSGRILPRENYQGPGDIVAFLKGEGHQRESAAAADAPPMSPGTLAAAAAAAARPGGARRGASSGSVLAVSDTVTGGAVVRAPASGSVHLLTAVAEVEQGKGAGEETSLQQQQQQQQLQGERGDAARDAQGGQGSGGGPAAADASGGAPASLQAALPNASVGSGAALGGLPFFRGATQAMAGLQGIIDDLGTEQLPFARSSPAEAPAAAAHSQQACVADFVATEVQPLHGVAAAGGPAAELPATLPPTDVAHLAETEPLEEAPAFPAPADQGAEEACAAAALLPPPSPAGYDSGEETPDELAPPEPGSAAAAVQSGTPDRRASPAAASPAEEVAGHLASAPEAGAGAAAGDGGGGGGSETEAEESPHAHAVLVREWDKRGASAAVGLPKAQQPAAGAGPASSGAPQAGAGVAAAEPADGSGGRSDSDFASPALSDASLRAAPALQHAPLSQQEQQQQQQLLLHGAVQRSRSPTQLELDVAPAAEEPCVRAGAVAGALQVSVGGVSEGNFEDAAEALPGEAAEALPGEAAEARGPAAEEQVSAEPAAAAAALQAHPVYQQPAVAVAEPAAAAAQRAVSPPAPPGGAAAASAALRQGGGPSTRSRSRSLTPAGGSGGRHRKQSAPARAEFSQYLPEADSQQLLSLTRMARKDGKAAAAAAAAEETARGNAQAAPPAAEPPPAGQLAAANAGARQGAAARRRAKRGSDGVELAPPLRRKGGRGPGSGAVQPAADGAVIVDEPAVTASAAVATAEEPAANRGRRRPAGSEASPPAGASGAAAAAAAEGEQQLGAAEAPPPRRRGRPPKRKATAAAGAPSDVAQAAEDEQQPEQEGAAPKRSRRAAAGGSLPDEALPARTGGRSPRITPAADDGGRDEAEEGGAGGQRQSGGRGVAQRRQQQAAEKGGVATDAAPPAAGRPLAQKRASGAAAAAALLQQQQEAAAAAAAVEGTGVAEPGRGGRQRRRVAQRSASPPAAESGRKPAARNQKAAPAALKRKAAPTQPAAEDEEAPGEERQEQGAKRRRRTRGSIAADASPPATTATKRGSVALSAPGTAAAGTAATSAGRRTSRGLVSPAAAAGSRSARPVCVALSGMHTDEQEQLAAQLRRLKVKCVTGNERHDWTPSVTHVVSAAPRRNQKCLAVMAGGGWLVAPGWVMASAAAGHLVAEAPYELSAAGTNVAAGAAAHWRERAAATGRPAFEGLRVAVAPQLEEPFKRDDIVNVVKAGGGRVVAMSTRGASSAPHLAVASQAAADAAEPALVAAAERGALVVAPLYVLEWVAAPLACLEQHHLLGSPGPELKAATAARGTVQAVDGGEPEQPASPSEASIVFD